MVTSYKKHPWSRLGLDNPTLDTGGPDPTLHSKGEVFELGISQSELGHSSTPF